MSPQIVLVGVSGAGKTTVGRMLASRLSAPFLDTDEDIEKAAGKPIPDIFVDDGELVFRSMERAAVARALVEHDGVLALGGGSVMDASTRQRLVGHHVVFLDVGLTEAVARIGLNRDRPLLLANPRATLKRMIEERRPYYVEVATSTVNTSIRTPDQVVEAVLVGVR